MKVDNIYKYKGVIKEIDGCLTFVSDYGETFSVMQNEMSRRLADTHEVCLIEVPSLKDGSPALYGNITSICGARNDPFAEGRAIAELYGLPRVYSQAVLDEVAKMTTDIPASEYASRLDLRNEEKMITIDPDNAGDHDDAFAIKKNPDGTITAIIAIADLDSTVDENSALFEHESKYCNSNYLGFMVYPMNPEKVANDINSLNEGVDKLVDCSIITFNPDGTIVSYAKCKGIINSKKRLTYKQADYLAFGKNSVGDEEDHSALNTTVSPEIIESIKLGYEFAQVLKEKRLSRGSLIIRDRSVKFDINEETLQVEGYSAGKTEETMGLIEEFALITNAVGTQICLDLDIPCMFRNHDPIRKEKEIALALALKEFGIAIPSHPTGKDFQKIIEANKNKRLGRIIESIILKALGHAYYSEKNNGHVGTGTVESRYRAPKNPDGTIPKKSDILKTSKSKFAEKFGKECGVYFEGDISYAAYAHLTSPIRRLSDVVNQKNFYRYILEDRIVFDKPTIAALAKKCTSSELIAEQAERDYDRMLMGNWGNNHLGVELSGIVVSFGKSKMTLMTDDNLIFYLPYENLSDRNLARNLAHPFKGEKRRLKLGTMMHCWLERVHDNRIIASQKEMQKQVTTDIDNGINSNLIESNEKSMDS